MQLVGLTGGIAMGKSTAMKFLLERGIPVVDTDQLARDVVEPGQPALEEIALTFGHEFITSDGTLDRAQLASLVFADPEKLKVLESILHPRIREGWKKVSQSWASQKIPLGVVVIPLLYETGAEGEFHSIVCVGCTGRLQRERLRSRGMKDEQVERRISAQWPIQQKMDLANYVIWTQGTLEVHRQQLEKLLLLMISA